MRERGKKVLGISIPLDVIEYLRRQSAVTLIAWGLLIVVLIGALDYWTIQEYSFFVFYLVPISLVTFGAGRNSGLLIAAVSTGAWLVDDLLPGGGRAYALVPFWNAVARLAVFSTVVILQDAFSRERHLARTDELTRLSNRKMFFDTAAAEIERAKRYGTPFSLAYLDLDNFKAVNDRYGHRTGDALLKIVSSVIKKNIRRLDAAARLGGDEFTILLPETGGAAAEAVVTKLRDLLQAAMDRHRWPVTFSIGIATYETPPQSVDEMVSSADDLMYSAKKSGKGRISRTVKGT